MVLASLAPALFLADVVYDPSPLRAHVAGRQPVPSVTQVLKAEGLTFDFSAIPDDVLERKRQIGEAAHRAAHYYDEGDLVPSSVAPEVRPYLEAWQRFRNERRFEPVLLETVVASSFGYVGRLDRVGRVDGRFVIADIKTGDPDAAAAHLQTAAYEDALRESYPDFAAELIDRWSIQLCADGRYRLSWYRQRTDRNEFLSALHRVHTRTAANGGVPCWMTA